MDVNRIETGPNCDACRRRIGVRGVVGRFAERQSERRQDIRASVGCECKRCSRKLATAQRTDELRVVLY